jgi:hypothetical protein
MPTFAGTGQDLAEAGGAGYVFRPARRRFVRKRPAVACSGTGRSASAWSGALPASARIIRTIWLPSCRYHLGGATPPDELDEDAGGDRALNRLVQAMRPPRRRGG